MILDISDPLYRQCSLTVMDNIADPSIEFDESGVCNYVHEYKKAEIESVLVGKAGQSRLAELVSAIKRKGRGKAYDCLIGLSGGVDSTYVAYLVKKHGLRPLAVHLDNGWNSELAVQNIENVIRKLDIDLFTLVIDWEEFRDIQLAYFKASVVDIEVVSDHAIFATMYRLARKHSISYIISGTNVVTEYIMPPLWLYSKMDFDNLQSIHNQYGKVKLKTYPYMDFKRYVYYSAALKLTPISILNYVPYNKKEIKTLISRELGWRDYGGKHYESTFTKFYQAYILPEKFKIDKRKAHLSTLICSGQITREEALYELSLPLYDSETLRRDKEYILKKWGLQADEFLAIMETTPRSHFDFETDTWKKQMYMRFLQRTKKFRYLLKHT